MAPDVQTVSIHEFLPDLSPHASATLYATMRMVEVMAVGGFVGWLAAAVPPILKNIMAQSWYRKQRRWFAIENRENYIQVHGVIYINLGHIPRVYNTGRAVFWIQRHYQTVLAHFQHWHGIAATEDLLTKLPVDWWERLDDYAPHVMTLAMVPDDGATLRRWLIEANPHELLWTLPKLVGVEWKYHSP